MNNIPEAKAGDIIICQGIRAEIAEIAYQECYPLEDGKYEWFMEFRDTKGVYRSWKSSLDGGEIILKDRYKIQIYQAPIWKPFCFRDFVGAKEYSTDKITEHYRCVYKGTIDTNNLDKIWEIFNVERPKDFKARSLSVSDIIVLSANETKDIKRYYVDSIGFHCLNDSEFPM